MTARTYKDRLCPASDYVPSRRDAGRCQGERLAGPGHSPCCRRLLRNASSLSSGSIPPRRSVERCDFVENPLLQLKIGIQIDLRGLDRLVTELQRNHGTARRPVAIDPSLLRRKCPARRITMSGASSTNARKIG